MHPRWKLCDVHMWCDVCTVIRSFVIRVTRFNFFFFFASHRICIAPHNVSYQRTQNTVFVMKKKKFYFCEVNAFFFFFHISLTLHLVFFFLFLSLLIALLIVKTLFKTNANENVCACMDFQVDWIVHAWQFISIRFRQITHQFCFIYYSNEMSYKIWPQ